MITTQESNAVPAAVKIGVVIVTHDSQAVIAKCIDCLKKQTLANWVAVIVDSGSQETDYLGAVSDDRRIRTAITGDNVGFCMANNIGYAALPADCGFVLFLNPDAFLTEGFLAGAVSCMAEPSHSFVGALTGRLLGYNAANDAPTGLTDSTGIFRTWYGRWFDRDQGRPADKAASTGTETVPAICGALMFCRRSALEQVKINTDQIFDGAFYMYKEDIDLSLRIRSAGWSLAYRPSLTAFHCRGWAKDRHSMPRRWRLLSARNDIRLCLRHTPSGIGYALAKYLYVRLLEK